MSCGWLKTKMILQKRLDGSGANTLPDWHRIETYFQKLSCINGVFSKASEQGGVTGAITVLV